MTVVPWRLHGGLAAHSPSARCRGGAGRGGDGRVYNQVMEPAHARVPRGRPGDERGMVGRVKALRCLPGQLLVLRDQVPSRHPDAGGHAALLAEFGSALERDEGPMDAGFCCCACVTSRANAPPGTHRPTSCARWPMRSRSGPERDAGCLIGRFNRAATLRCGCRRPR